MSIVRRSDLIPPEVKRLQLVLSLINQASGNKCQPTTLNKSLRRPHFTMHLQRLWLPLSSCRPRITSCRDVWKTLGRNLRRLRENSVPLSTRCRPDCCSSMPPVGLMTIMFKPNAFWEFIYAASHGPRKPLVNQSESQTTGNSANRPKPPLTRSPWPAIGSAGSLIGLPPRLAEPTPFAPFIWKM